MSIVVSGDFVQNPFCPGGVVDPTFFSGRQEEMSTFRRSLLGAKHGTPQHLAILGARGIGKTSLLRYLSHLARNERCLVLRLELDPSVTTLEELCQLIRKGLYRGGSAYSAIERTASTLRKFFDAYQVSFSAAGFSAEISKKIEADVRLGFRDSLIEIWSKTSGVIPAIVIMIDEAEQLEKIPGALQFLRNTFSRLSEEKCGYLVILCGKLNLYSDLSELHSPLARFFKPLILSLLSREDSAAVLKKPFLLAKRGIGPAVLQKSYFDSKGHPYILQAIGFELFESNADITCEVYDAIRPMILRTLETQLFSELYNKASPQERNILSCLAKAGAPVSTTQIANSLRKPLYLVSPLLSRLVDRGSILRLERGSYSLFHPLFSEFIRKNKTKYTI